MYIDCCNTRSTDWSKTFHFIPDEIQALKGVVSDLLKVIQPVVNQVASLTTFSTIKVEIILLGREIVKKEGRKERRKGREKERERSNLIKLTFKQHRVGEKEL